VTRTKRYGVERGLKCGEFAPIFMFFMKSFLCVYLLLTLVSIIFVTKTCTCEDEGNQ
jgi:hypothetical protein